MNIDEQAANQLIAYLNSGIDFATVQAPLLAQEIIRWSLFGRCIGAIIGSCMIVAGAIFIYRKWNKWVTPTWNDVVLIPIVIILAGTVITICNGVVIGKILLAPRLYLLEYVSRLL